jgi:erythronate-4-phosphate dehydrogenase
MIKIIADENIEFLEEAFSALGELTKLPGREISNKALREADALLIRSVTQINESLLSETKIKFVGTATIGSDHVDKDYLSSKKIFFTDAAGCNSDAVTEYFFTALFQIAAEENIDLRNKTLGIVGVGNIGGRIERMAKAIGLGVLKNDPPLKRNTDSQEYLELDELMEADIITLHVPLIKEGVDKTLHLFDRERLNKLKYRSILINTSRGPVIDNAALNEIIFHKKLSVILDVWENEPNINTELLNKVKIGTPHIAGYSLEGKVNGTVILYKALCYFLKVSPTWKPQLPEVNKKITISDAEVQQSLQEIFSSIYKIREDDLKTREIKNLDTKDRGIYFDSLRKNYPLRREFPNYSVQLNTQNTELEKIIKVLGFRIWQ